MENSLELNDDIPNIVLEYSTSIIRLAFTYLKNMADSEDVAQDVFLTYMKNAPKFENKAHQKAWLMKVTANKCKNYLKTYWNTRTLPLSEDLCYLTKEESTILQTVFDLNEKYRITIYLYYYEGYSIKEIAGLLKKCSSTIGTWLERGRKLIKIRLGDEYYV